jgi:uncharacterized protein (DUF2141 family)
MKFATFALIALFPLTAVAEGVPGSHFIENWDQNGDGVVTLDELKQKRGDVFYTFDSDENGFLNAEEYSYFDDARQADMEGQDEQEQAKGKRVQKGMVLAFNDTNADGQVSKAEFLEKAEDWLALIDRDGSGDVTTADFGPRN